MNNDFNISFINKEFHSILYIIKQWCSYSLNRTSFIWDFLLLWMKTYKQFLQANDIIQIITLLYNITKYFLMWICRNLYEELFRKRTILDHRLDKYFDDNSRKISTLYLFIWKKKMEIPFVSFCRHD